MAQFDATNNTEAAFGMLATLSGATPAKGNIIDMQGWGSLDLHVQTGTVTDAGTASGFSFEVQESDTTADADFTAVADADLIGTEAALTVTDDDADNIVVGKIGYRGSKRYVRIVATGTTGTNATVCVSATKGHGAIMGSVSIADNIAAT
jgi:hypothetical protein